MLGRCFDPLHGPNFIKFDNCFDLHLDLELGGEKCPKCCSRQGPEAICDVSNMLQKGTKRFLMGSKKRLRKGTRNGQNKAPKKVQNVVPVKDRRHFEYEVWSERRIQHCPKNVSKMFRKGSPKVFETLRILWFLWFYNVSDILQKCSKKVPKTT